MGGAIVTHITVLLQFQQWEDNQKFDASFSFGSNGTKLAAMVEQ